MDLLSDGNSSDIQEEPGFSKDDQNTLKINSAFAERYEYNERRKLLEKGKLKYGDKLMSSGRDGALEEGELESESSSSEDDSEAELLNPTVEKKFLQVMAAIRANDPKLKNQETNFFDDKDFEKGSGGKVWAGESEGRLAKRDKKMTLKDQIREQTLKKMGKDSESSDSGSEDDSEAEGGNSGKKRAKESNLFTKIGVPQKDEEE